MSLTTSTTTPLICLMGPTAAGKTAVAVALAQRFPCDIISVDSAMVYRGMDIGTAKPDATLLQRAPHRLINIREPNDAYSVGQFYLDAQHEIAAIKAQQRIPLLVGGTMLYFRALQQGLSELPSANADVRARLAEQAQQLGWPVLHKQLQSIDPIAALRIHPHDAQRIQRALEIYELTGKSLTTHWQQYTAMLKMHQMINIVIAPADRQILHQRIADRFQQMLAQGFIEEVANLQKRGNLTPDMPSMRAVGYRQVWDFLEGKLSDDELSAQGIAATRQLAKRQLTWLRAWPNCHWFDSEDPAVLEKVIARGFTKIS